MWPWRAHWRIHGSRGNECSAPYATRTGAPVKRRQASRGGAREGAIVQSAEGRGLSSRRGVGACALDSTTTTSKGADKMTGGEAWLLQNGHGALSSARCSGAPGSCETARSSICTQRMPASVQSCVHPLEPRSAVNAVDIVGASALSTIANHAIQATTRRRYKGDDMGRECNRVWPLLYAPAPSPSHAATGARARLHP